eukprot:scaffold3.g6367.t1
MEFAAEAMERAMALGAEEREEEWVEAEEPVEGDEVDFEAGPDEVVRRIESATLWLLDQLVSGALPDMEIVSRQASNRALEPTGEGEQYALRLQHRRVVRSLAGRHPESADQVARIFLVLDCCHELLLEGTQATQREVYYRLKTEECVRGMRDVAEAVQDCVCLLRVPRSHLGICASSKGLVAGRLVIHDRRSGTEVDCSAAAEGHPISGDITQLSQLCFQTDASCVLVVEKDAVFQAGPGPRRTCKQGCCPLAPPPPAPSPPQRLLEARLPDLTRCVLATGKGVPDLATRALLARLVAAFPQLPLYALVDWNPHGVNIATIYKYGSHRMGLESPRYALPALRWLGARAGQLLRADGGAFQPLTPRDRALAGSLGAALAAASPAWADELRQMADSGSKAELEAVPGLVDVLLDCLERDDAI